MNSQPLILILILILFLAINSLLAQNKVSISGIVKDLKNNETIENVVVYIDSTTIHTETNEIGSFKLDFSIDRNYTVVFSRVDYQTKSFTFPASTKNQFIIAFLSSVTSDLNVVVSENKVEQMGIIRESAKDLVRVPNNSNNIESFLPGIALGVNTGLGGELSAQYNVRGGNYDENLVYVNGFEIYRPQLIRSSTREGLTFPNPDLIKSLTFSSGGFQANYGDKLSSILDVQYKKPDSLAASIGVSLLGGSFHIEGKEQLGRKRKNFRYLLGGRYKNTDRLLRSFDTKDATGADFGDVQGYFTYEITPQLEFSFLTNFNTNQYTFRPKESQINIGASKDLIFQFDSKFRGFETTDYKFSMNGISLNYLPKRKHPTYLNLSASFYNNKENEQSDIFVVYELNEIDSDIFSDNYGEIIANVANGGQYNFIQNEFRSKINSIQHRGGIEFPLNLSNPTHSLNSFLQWGINYQKESIKDTIIELERIGSEAYSLQVDVQSIPINSSISNSIVLESYRFSGFLQNSFLLRKNEQEIKLTTGLRASYWDFNEVFFITPRMQLSYAPNKNLAYHLATGLYYQSPFYREFRNINGEFNKEIIPQKSWQIVGGIEYDFIFKRSDSQKFKFIVEAYYKKLWDLITYDLEDVKIRYAGANNATGYALGLDLRLNGNFAPNSESWINLSFLRAREAIDGIQHKRATSGNPNGEDIGNVPRPNDRFMNLSVFFQDHFPRFKRLEAYINYNVGTGLPYGFEGNNVVFRNNLRYRASHQFNIGFSLSLWEEAWRDKKPRHWLGFTQSAWLSFDLINLLNIRNVASNRFISTSTGQYTIPNYLTSRTLNIRFRIDF